MLERITELISSGFEWLIVQLVEPVFYVTDALIRLFATEGMLRDLLSYAWINNVILGAQAIAGAVMACRFTWEALMMASLRAEGAPTDPGGLIKRTVMSAIAITGGPFVVKNAIIVGNMLALWVANIGTGVGFDTLTSSEIVESGINTALVGVGTVLGLGKAIALGPLAWGIITFIIMLILFLIFMQAVIRTIEITFAAIISPFAAIGYMSGGGMADSWIREVIIIAVTHALQLTMLVLSITLIIGVDTGGSISAVMRPFFGLGGLWVTFRTPRVIKNYVYHTGIGGAASTTARSASYTLISTLGRMIR